MSGRFCRPRNGIRPFGVSLRNVVPAAAWQGRGDIHFICVGISQRAGERWRRMRESFIRFSCLAVAARPPGQAERDPAEDDQDAREVPGGGRGWAGGRHPVGSAARHGSAARQGLVGHADHGAAAARTGRAACAGRGDRHRVVQPAVAGGGVLDPQGVGDDRAAAHREVPVPAQVRPLNDGGAAGGARRDERGVVEYAGEVVAHGGVGVRGGTGVGDREGEGDRRGPRCRGKPG